MVAEQVGGIFYDVTLDTRKLVEGRRVVDRELEAAARSFNAVTAAVKLYAAAMALVKSAQMADEVRLLAARVQVAAGSMEAGAAAMAKLQQISVRTQTSIEANAAVFQRLNASIRQMGGTQADTLRITELLSMAVKVSGASAAEAASAMTQFGQALGSGKLQGDELRSLLENAPYLMQQLADGIGVPVGALRQLGEEGKLTADVVTNALTKAASRIDADFKKLPQTFDAAMATLVSQLRRAVEASDTLTGTSAALTGAATGAAEAFDALATSLLNMTSESDRLGRSSTVQTWAENTALALSYVADAGDFVVRYFQIMGRGIGGVAAAVSEFATGLSGAKRAAEIVRTMRADMEAIGNRPLIGAGMRQRAAALATGTDGSDPMDRRANAGGTSQLRAPGGLPDQKAAKKAADAARKASEERTKGYIEQVEAERRIQEEADAAAIRFFEGQERRREEEARAEEAAKRARERGQGFAAGLIASGDPVAALELELQQKTDLLKQYAEQDQANADLYAQARVALEEQTWQRIREVGERQRVDQIAAQSALLQTYGGLFGNIADLTKSFAGEQSDAYKAMFAVSKAFAIADAIIKIQQGVANALSLPFPANVTAAASTAAAAAGIVQTIRGTNFGGGRQYGGPVQAGSMYRVNESGRPEMFTAANGSQYMLPTQGGRVTAAGEVGAGSGGWTLVINEVPAGMSFAPLGVDQERRIVTLTARQVKAEIAGEFASNTGPAWSALAGASNVRGRL